MGWLKKKKEKEIFSKPNRWQLVSDTYLSALHFDQEVLTVLTDTCAQVGDLWTARTVGTCCNKKTCGSAYLISAVFDWFIVVCSSLRNYYKAPSFSSVWEIVKSGPHIDAPSPGETLLVPFLTAQYYLELLGGNKGWYHCVWSSYCLLWNVTQCPEAASNFFLPRHRQVGKSCSGWFHCSGKASGRVLCI